MANVLKQRVTWRATALVGCESTLMAAAALASASVVLGRWAWRTEPGTLARILLISVLAQLCLYCGDLYEWRVAQDRQDRFVRTLESVATAALMLAMLYLLVPSLVVGPGVAVLTAGVAAAIGIAWRAAFVSVARLARSERMLIVGTGPAALRLCREIQGRAELGMTVVGLVTAGSSRGSLPSEAPPVVGDVDELAELVDREAIDRVVVSLGDARGRLPMDRLVDTRLAGVRVDELPSVYEECAGKVTVEDLRPSWIVFSSGFRRTRVRVALKRAADVCAAAIGLLLASPVLLAVAAAVRLTSRGPALYHQARVGRNGQTFMVHKFRSMRVDAEAGTGAVWASAGDRRVTPLGRWLRRTRADELPQLWNVLRGEMSLVGPRPERPEFVSQLAREIPFYPLRHVVRPGLTGWAQVRYPYGSTVEDAREKLQYELFYLKNFSLWLDALIVLKTVKTVLLGRGAR
jgi:sugar transferase (PEP-CTERM system associated)